MDRGILSGIVAMSAVVAVSNVLVQFLVGPFLTWAAFTYPLAFLVTDLVNRLRGPEAARRVVMAGFLVGLVWSLVGTQIEGPFGPFVTVRVAVGSAVAFLSAQLVDIAVFNRLRAGAWWRAPLASSVVGGALDTALFFSIAFSATLAFIAPGVDVAWANAPLPLLGFGPEAPLWAGLAIADLGCKLGVAALSLAPFRMLVARLRPVG